MAKLLLAGILAFFLSLMGCHSSSSSNDGDGDGGGGGGGRWSSTGGPSGGNIDGIALNLNSRDERTVDEVIVGTRGGIYSTSNAGTSWRFFGTSYPFGNVTALTASRGTPITVYAGVDTGSRTTRGVYFYDNANGTWSRRHPTTNEDGTEFALSNIDVSPSLLYAAVNTGTASTLYYSGDSGLNWETRMLPANTNEVKAIITKTQGLSPINQLYLLTEDAVYMTQDGGTVQTGWEVIFDRTTVPLPQPTLNSLVLQEDSTLGDDLFLGTSNGIFRAINNPRKFETTPFCLVGENVTAMFVSRTPARLNEMYAGGVNGTQAHLYSILDTHAAATVTAVDTGIGNFAEYRTVTALAIGFNAGPTGDDAIYRGAAGFGMLYQNTAGANFAERSAGMVSTGVNSLVVGPANSNQIAAGTDSGFYFSQDIAKNGWTRASVVSETIFGNGGHRAVIASHDFTTFFTAYENNVLTWQQANGFGGPPVSTGSVVNAMSMIRSGVNAGRVYIATAGNKLFQGRSNHPGTPNLTAITSLTPAALTVVAAADNNNDDVVHTSDGTLVYTSTDSGATWNAGFNPGGAGTIRALATSSGGGLNVFAGYENSGGTAGVYFSSDTGNTWNQIGATSAFQVYAIATTGNPTQVYVGTTAGVYFVDALNGTASARNNGLGSSWQQNVRALAVYPPDGNYVYAGTVQNGVYRTTGGGN